jgi:hypothetical protein
MYVGSENGPEQLAKRTLKDNVTNIVDNFFYYLLSLEEYGTRMMIAVYLYIILCRALLNSDSRTVNTQVKYLSSAIEKRYELVKLM